MKCVYCNTEDNLTSSDIIPYAITGAKLAKKFVCYKHNAFTNDNYEKKFIADLDYFRNELGLLTRDGKRIQFTGDIIIGDEVIRGVKLSDRKSLYNPKGGVIAGKNGNDNKVLLGTIDKFKKMGAKNYKPIDPSKTTIRKTISTESFFSNAALHSVAKISYEWYCYHNHIEEYIDSKYKEIVDYILNNVEDKTIVQLVIDGNHYTAIDVMADIGTNSLYQYDDIDGYTYVIFNLWNAISYKTKICKTGKDTNHVSSLIGLDKYNVDGTKSTQPFGTYSFRGNFSVKSIQVDMVGFELWKEFANRFNEIFKTFIVTIHTIKRHIDKLSSNLNSFKNGKIDLAELFEYEDHDLLVTIKIISAISKNKERYDATKSFNENLKAFIDMDEDCYVKITPEQLKEYLRGFVALNEKQQLTEYLQTTINDFNDIYQIEIQRSQD